jgi:hypothetical protein
VNCVEQEAERGVRLPAVLRAEADENRATEADARAHDGGAACNHAFTFEPPAHEHVARRVSSDDIDRR